MGRVARSVGDENAVEMMSDLVNGIVVWERRHTGTAADQASKNVFLDTAIDDGYVKIAFGGADMEGRLRADLVD